MTEQDFQFICRWLRDRCAIALEDGKQYLVESRLNPLVKRMNLDSISDLVMALRIRPDSRVDRQIVEAMVTTESSFFRDHHPFEALRKVVVPELIRRRQTERRLTVWCAACSNGQEPYSVAMLLREHFPELATWVVSLIASDISREVLDRARLGRFNQVEANRGLPATLLVRYFEQHGTDWQIQPVVRNMVDFREINLAQPWPALPPMDLILIRNVMIYFDVATKKSILGRIARLLKPDGYLLLGGAETTFNLDNSFERVEPIKSGLYRLVNRPAD